MVQADELAANVKKAEAALAVEQRSVESDRRAMATEMSDLRQALERMAHERVELVAAIAPDVLATFDLVAKRRNGVAVAEAREGICTICHVRLRPQVFNTIRRNAQIVQCDSCQRILFHVPPPAAPAHNGSAIDSTAR